MTESVLDHVETRFAEVLRRDERPGYTGYVVAPDRLLETARTLRSNLGFDYLSSVTGVDYLLNLDRPLPVLSEPPLSPARGICSRKLRRGLYSI